MGVSLPGIRRLAGQRYRLKGTQCPNCGRLCFPPRQICPNCHQTIEGDQLVKHIQTEGSLVAQNPMAAR